VRGELNSATRVNRHHRHRYAVLFGLPSISVFTWFDEICDAVMRLRDAFQYALGLGSSFLVQRHARLMRACASVWSPRRVGVHGGLPPRLPKSAATLKVIGDATQAPPRAGDHRPTNE
jgi:hypothetical protein